MRAMSPRRQWGCRRQGISVPVRNVIVGRGGVGHRWLFRPKRTTQDIHPDIQCPPFSTKRVDPSSPATRSGSGPVGAHGAFPIQPMREMTSEDPPTSGHRRCTPVPPLDQESAEQPYFHGDRIRVKTSLCKHCRPGQARAIGSPYSSTVGVCGPDCGSDGDLRASL